MNNTFRVCKWALVLCISVTTAIATRPARAIIMRDDVPDERYRNFGESMRGYLVQLNLPGSKAGSTPRLYNGMGTMIAPHWVITAAHATDRLLPGTPSSVNLAQHVIYVNGRGYRIAGVFVHPAYAPAKGQDPEFRAVQNDIALIKLADDVQDARVACLYDNKDELDKFATLAGMGLPGTGVAGTGKFDGVLRGATVRVDKVDQNVISWQFRPPGDPRTTALEGISGPGDSGGPAFIADQSGNLCVAGISSSQANEGTDSVYGVTEYYARVSSHLDWIRQVMRDNG